MKWIDLENDPAPQWVGDMACSEIGSVVSSYAPRNYFSQTCSFKALCRRIYRTETPPVDPDFERMTQTIAAYELFCGNEFLAKIIAEGNKSDSIQAALDAWNETVVS